MLASAKRWKLLVATHLSHPIHSLLGAGRTNLWNDFVRRVVWPLFGVPCLRIGDLNSEYGFAFRTLTKRHVGLAGGISRSSTSPKV